MGWKRPGGHCLHWEVGGIILALGMKRPMGASSKAMRQDGSWRSQTWAVASQDGECAGGKGSRPSGLTADRGEDEKERQSRGGVNLEESGVHGREWDQLGLVVS